MNDFDYDVLQKKSLVASARRRVCGSKTKYCSLPSDHLSESQWKKKNGEVMTYRINDPISWYEFKCMPKDLQQAYINWLCDRFEASTGMINRYLFKNGRNTLEGYLVKRGLVRPQARRGKTNAQIKKRFIAWCAGATLDEDTADTRMSSSSDSPEHIEHAERPDPVTPDEPTPVLREEVSLDPARLTEFNLTIEGRFDPSYLSEALSRIIYPGTVCHMRISVDMQ